MSRFGKTFVKLLHILRRKVFRPFSFCFDERILQLIFQNLSLVDQVCLSLTCKKFFNLFGTIAKHQDFQFPRLLRIRNPILCANSKDVPRNKLLLRLEHRRWAYCAECLKLHPRKEFARHLLRKSALERSCTYYAGIVDLCPCISLTIRGRDQLVKILKSPAKQDKYKYGQFEYEPPDDGPPTLGHTCLFKSESGYHIRVALVFFIKQTGHLCVLGRHTITFSSSADHLTAAPTFACPHQDLLPLVSMDQAKTDPIISQIFNHSTAHQQILYLFPEMRISKVCPVCPSLITKQNSAEGTDMATFWMARNLGGCEWPANRCWFEQCRLTGASFELNEIYWHRSQHLLELTQGVHGQWKKDYCLEQNRLKLQNIAFK